MRTLAFFRFFVVLFFLTTVSFLHAATTLKDPIVAPIPGLTISSAPGQITITNSSGKDIPVGNMLLTFDLAQASISSVWGSPWLDWKVPTSKAKQANQAYEFANNAKLPNNVFQSGQTITVQYSPQPWDNKNAPQNVQLFSITYPLYQANISATTASQWGTNTVTIINNSDQALSLDGAEVHFTYGSNITSSIWGTPWANWIVSQGSPSFVLKSGAASQVPGNGTMTVVFNGDTSPISNIQLWVKSGGQPVPPATKGELDINFPAMPAGVTAAPVVTIQGPSFPQGMQFTGTWGQMLAKKDLLVGSYSLTAPDLTTPNQVYTASINPNPIVVADKQIVSAAITYNVKQFGQLMIQMPAQPAEGVVAPVITVTGADFPSGKKITTSWGNSYLVCPGDATSCPGISAGNYTIAAPKVFSLTDAYSVTGLDTPVQVTLGQTTNVPVSYNPVAKGTFNTTIAMNAQASKPLEYFTVNFANQSGYTFAKTLSLGTNQVSLPISDTYAITTQDMSGYSAIINPTTVTVSQSGTPNVNIQYQKGSAQKLVVYYGGWQGDIYNLKNLPANVTAVNLSFANITSDYKVDTSVSGYLTNIPAQGAQMWPTYINWTTFKFSRPNTKILLAVGGATFSNIWNSVLTPQSADTIAKNIAAVVNQSYPAYKGQFANPSDLLGYVTIDGVDLDVEANGRISPQVASNVILLAQNLKKYMNPGKLLTMASFSVGADPNNDQCTVPGSLYCGEDIPILQGIGGILDWVNVMAYDAGQEYAASKYQIALANYATYVAKGKILLGLDVQTQWPGFTETAAQLAAKAAWEKQNQYGGAMFWGVGVANNPTLEQSYITAISAAIGN